MVTSHLAEQGATSAGSTKASQLVGALHGLCTAHLVHEALQYSLQGRVGPSEAIVASATNAYKVGHLFPFSSSRCSLLCRCLAHLCLSPRKLCWVLGLQGLLYDHAYTRHTTRQLCGAASWAASYGSSLEPALQAAECVRARGERGKHVLS